MRALARRTRAMTLERRRNSPKGRANHAQVYKRMVTQSDGSTKKAKLLHSHKSLGFREHHVGFAHETPEIYGCVEAWPSSRCPSCCHLTGRPSVYRLEHGWLALGRIASPFEGHCLRIWA